MIESQRELDAPYDWRLAGYYFQLAYARDGAQDWLGAEEAWLESIDIYNAIMRITQEVTILRRGLRMDARAGTSRP
jgi:hypothetical protein